MKRLRTSMAEEELTTKQARLETLVARAAQLEAGIPEQPQAPPPPPRPVPRRRQRIPVALIAVVGVVVVVGAIGGLVASGVVSLGGGPAPTAEPPKLTTMEFIPEIPIRQALRRGETFFTAEVQVSYTAGAVLLSGEPPPDGQFWIDDAITLTVRRPDGTTATWRRDFNRDCLANMPLPPQDISELFLPGRNMVSISLLDVCGATVGTSGPISLSIHPL